MFASLLGKLRLKTPRSDQGQDLAEYSLLLGLLALVVIISVSLIGMSISDIFSYLADFIDF